MKLVSHPEFTFTSSEKEAADVFCAVCESIAEELNNYLDPVEVEELWKYLENVIQLNWDDFLMAVRLLSNFINDRQDETD